VAGPPTVVVTTSAPVELPWGEITGVTVPARATASSMERGPRSVTWIVSPGARANVARGSGLGAPGTSLEGSTMPAFTTVWLFGVSRRSQPTATGFP
jgi:hypothetical protein